MPQLDLMDTTDTSITLRLGGLGNPATSSYYSYIAISKTTSPSETTQIWGSVSYGSSGNYYTANVTFYGLNPGTSYSFRGDATPNGSTMRSFYGTFSTTGSQADTTSPTVSITNYNGANNITISWSAYDNVALRSSNTYALYISGRDNSNLSFVQYVGLGTSSYTFNTDANGEQFANNSLYLVRVVAVDSSGNTGYAERFVTVIKTKPSFSWSYPKASGSSFNIYATEWNNLLDKVNEFRQYKGLSAINTFTYAYSGMEFTASMMNQPINIINTMSPNTSTPSVKVKGDSIFASDINRLRDSLNSIP